MPLTGQPFIGDCAGEWTIFEAVGVPRFTFHNALERTFMQVSLGLLAKLSLRYVNVPHTAFPT